MCRRNNKSLLYSVPLSNQANTNSRELIIALVRNVAGADLGLSNSQVSPIYISLFMWKVKDASFAFFQYKFILHTFGLWGHSVIQLSGSCSSSSGSPKFCPWQGHKSQPVVNSFLQFPLRTCIGIGIMSRGSAGISKLFISTQISVYVTGAMQPLRPTYAFEKIKSSCSFQSIKWLNCWPRRPWLCWREWIVEKRRFGKIEWSWVHKNHWYIAWIYVGNNRAH